MTIIAIYFAQTSLSTVGFGDYYPRSDAERLLVVAILVFGQAIFSIMMGKFINILEIFKEFDAPLDKGE